jgi:hypothetical protein
VASVVDRARRASGFPRRLSRWWWLGLAGGVLVIAVLVVHPVLGGPSFVHRLTIANPSEFDVTVAVSPAGRQERLPLGAVGRRSSIDLQDVIDQGSRWAFHFSSGGQDGGEVQVPRAELGRNGWRLQIPREVVDRLRARGAKPPPF